MDIFLVIVVFVAILVLIGMRMRASRSPRSASLITPQVSQREPPVKQHEPYANFHSYDELHSLLRANRLIQAIKLYRQETGVGLKEARRTVELIQQHMRPETGPLRLAAPPQDLPVEGGGDLAEVRLFLQSGQKIAALKLYRQLTGVGLKEAKLAVESLQADGSLPDSQTTLATTTTTPSADDDAAPGVDPEVLQRFLRQGQKIQAIKYYRQQTGVGLKVAKLAVESLQADGSLPDSQTTLTTTTTDDDDDASPGVDPEVLQTLLYQGQKIQAIKYYRQLTGVGLKEAKLAVESIQIYGSLPASQATLTTTASHDDGSELVDPEVLQRFLRQGQKIQAIKYYRQQRKNVSLKEAKEAVDWLADHLPEEPLTPDNERPSSPLG